MEKENANPNTEAKPAESQAAVTEDSNAPESFKATRHGITLVFAKQNPRRAGKGGKTLFPTYAPLIDSKSIGSYIKFCGKDEFFAELNGTIFTKFYKQQQKRLVDGKEESCWSTNGLKFDLDTAIALAEAVEDSPSVSQTKFMAECQALTEQVKACQARLASDPKAMEEFLALTTKLSALLCKQAEAKHGAKS